MVVKVGCVVGVEEFAHSRRVDPSLPLRSGRGQEWGRFATCSAHFGGSTILPISTLPSLSSTLHCPLLLFLTTTMANEMNVAGFKVDTPEQYHKVFQLPIPVPKLVHSFRLACDLEPVRSLGEGVGGDGGQ